MVDFTKLKKLREETGVSFSACKKALEEANDNLEAAKKKLKEWGNVKAKEKSDRQTSQGAIFAYVHHNMKIASLVELACETDFVSGNKEFQLLGQELAMQAATIRAVDEKEFLKTEYIRDPGKTVDGLIKEAIAKFGENIQLIRITRWETGE